MNYRCDSCNSKGWYNEISSRGSGKIRRRCCKCKGSGYVRILSRLPISVHDSISANRRRTDIAGCGVNHDSR